MKPKQKKVDTQALTSAFMRIPKLNLFTARCLLDLGFKAIYELQGRCPENLFAEISKKKKDLPSFLHKQIHLAVQFSEKQEG